MPNLNPPLYKCQQALKYRQQLQLIDSSVDYLMTLYLSKEISVDDLHINAKECHVQGVGLRVDLI